MKKRYGKKRMKKRASSAAMSEVQLKQAWQCMVGNV